MIRGYVGIHSVNQVLIRRAELGAIRIRRVVSIARRRRPGVKIVRPDESLSNDSRTYDFFISHDQLTVGFVFEKQLRQSRDYQRINDSQ